MARLYDEGDPQSSFACYSDAHSTWRKMQQLVKHGEDLALVLPQEWLELLRINMETPSSLCLMVIGQRVSKRLLSADMPNSMMRLNGSRRSSNALRPATSSPPPASSPALSAPPSSGFASNTLG
jgi:hypothetical protein